MLIVYKRGNICIAGLNRRAGYTTVYKYILYTICFLQIPNDSHLLRFLKARDFNIDKVSSVKSILPFLILKSTVTINVYASHGAVIRMFHCLFIVLKISLFWYATIVLTSFPCILQRA